MNIVRKKVLLFIGGLVLGVVIYIGFQMYQTNQLELITVEDIQTFDVSTNDELNENTIIQVEVDVGNFEALAMAQTEVVKDTIYLMIYKWPAIQQVDEIDFDLESIPGLEGITRIAVIYGDPFSGEGHEHGYFINDLIDHPDQDVIWKKEDRE